PASPFSLPPPRPPTPPLFPYTTLFRSRRHLPARRRNVLPARPPDEHGHVAFDQYFMKTQNAFHRRRAVRQFGRRVVRDQVHFGPNAVEQFDKAPRVFVGIVDAVEHHVFERQPLAFAERVLAAGFHQVRERILAIDRHQLRTLFFGGGRERDRQTGADLLFGECVYARADA